MFPHIWRTLFVGQGIRASSSEQVRTCNAETNNSQEVALFLILRCLSCLNHLWPLAGWKVKEAFVLNSVRWWHSQSTTHAVCHERLTHILLTWVRISSWPIMCSRVLARPGGTPSSEACAWTRGWCCDEPWVCVWWVEEEMELGFL